MSQLLAQLFLPLPPFLLEHRQLAGEQTPSETVSSLDVPRNHLLLNLRNFHRDFTLCTTEFPPSRVYYSPGPRRKGRNVSRRKPITHHAYTLLTLNYRYDDEIGIDLWKPFAKSPRLDSFFFFLFFSLFFFFFSRWISFRIKRNYPFILWSGGGSPCPWAFRSSNN